MTQNLTLVRWAAKRAFKELIKKMRSIFLSIKPSLAAEIRSAKSFFCINSCIFARLFVTLRPNLHTYTFCAYKYTAIEQIITDTELIHIDYGL